jgi:uncharacterized protein (DUF433 family)
VDEIMAIEFTPGLVVDPAVCFGKPVIKGTRVPVDVVIGKPAGGMTPDDVTDEYGITLEGIRAALRYVASILAGNEVQGSE